MKRSTLQVLIALITLLGLAATVDRPALDGAETLYINQEFYLLFNKIPAVKRDEFWEGKLDSLVLTRARVLNIDKTGRYKKKFRIALEDADAAAAGLRFTYHVFIDSQDTIDLLAQNEILEFSGQLMGFTPLATDRKSYLFDILLEKGAILVQCRMTGDKAPCGEAMSQYRHESDFLIIGSGIAGLTFAIKASSLGTVTIVTKKKEFDSNTNYAQGGIASVLSPDDSFESHVEDTLRSGAGLCNRSAVDFLVKNGPDRIQELIDWGTRFTMGETQARRKSLALGREGGHSFNRIVHATDLTGREIERALLAKISEIPAITVFEDHTAIDLLTEHQLSRSKKYYQNKIRGQVRCYGAYILNNRTGMVGVFNAKITFLATGGVGQVYLHTTNPDIATGDGIAMAYRAGALIADMEFIQFHPTTLYSPKSGERSFLISEAVRGEGAVLLNRRGDRFMENIHPLRDLAPRDIVARTIDAELKKSGDSHVYLDITAKGRHFLQKRFPHIFNKCLEEGIDISRDPIPVVPAAHYLCGGIVSDLKGRTTIDNLYVSGESACTGVHGANRLASNSLLEGVVFSHSAFMHISETFRSLAHSYKAPEFPAWNREGTFDFNEWVLVKHDMEDIKRLMWDYVGIVRSDLRLMRAYNRILFLAEEVHSYYRKSIISSRVIELRNMATVAKLIIKSALMRKDSIGLHYNTDHSESDVESANVVLRSKYEPRFIRLDRHDPRRGPWTRYTTAKKKA